MRSKWCSRPRMLSKLRLILFFFITCSKTKLLKLLYIPVVGLLFYELYEINVYEYLMTKSYIYFKYPLDVDINDVVDTVLNGDTPAVAPINKWVYPLIYDSDQKCKTETGADDDVFMLLVIKSAAKNFELRNMVRKTWGLETLFPYTSVRRVFMLGIGNKTTQPQIGMEQAQFNDIVQEYFIDDYWNNTLKMMMGFRWAAANCRGARFVVFIDDDCYLSQHNLLSVLHRNNMEAKLNNAILGHLINYGMPFRLRSSKWYTSLDEYPYRFWPPYVAGGLYVMTHTTVKRLSIAMEYIKYLRFDDVLLGIASKKLHLSLIHLDNLYLLLEDKNRKYDKKFYENVIGIHGWTDPEALYTVWREQRKIWRRKHFHN